MGILSEAISMGRIYLGKGYPPFVYANPTHDAQLPAFFYHDLPAAQFEAQIGYLEENGYTTLTCDGAVSALRSPALDRAKQVLLTFDDGLASLYRDIFPLAVRHQIYVVAYIVPAWVGQPGFVSWAQCREMHDSGWVDLQSHSYTHARVVTEATPESWWLAQGPDARPWGIAGFEPDWLSRKFPALPNLRGDSLFAGKPALVFPERFWEQCSRIAANSSESARASALAATIDGNPGALQSLEAMAMRMRRDIERSKESIEREIPGHIVRHFAFPWHINSPMAWQAVEAAGFVSAAIGLSDTENRFDAAPSVTGIVRVNGDFLTCLPGRTRRHFLQVVAHKIARRANRRTPYGIAS